MSSGSGASKAASSATTGAGKPTLAIRAAQRQDPSWTCFLVGADDRLAMKAIQGMGSGG